VKTGKEKSYGKILHDGQRKCKNGNKVKERYCTIGQGRFTEGKNKKLHPKSPKKTLWVAML
jgi:hypothetical protein